MYHRLAIGAALVAIAATGFVITRHQASHGVGLKPVPQAAGEVVPGGWTCPMHPDLLRDAPGSCPICGMALVRAAGPAADANPAVPVSVAQQQRIGLMLETVGASALTDGALVSGQIVQDDSASVQVVPKAEGWVRRLAVGGVGDKVSKGQLLYELYSPELQQRQRDYLDLLTRRDALTNRPGGMGPIGNTAPEIMLASIAKERFRARARLVAADIPEDVLQELEASRRVRELLPVRAEHDGIVTGLAAREGAAVGPAQPVLSYADTRRVAVELTLSPRQLGALGSQARVRLQSSVDPRQTLVVTARAQQAVVDPVSRQARLRATLNPGAHAAAFPPGSLVRAQLADAMPTVITVPSDAVLRMGDTEQVIVADGDTGFRPATVILGRSDGERIEVREGLEPGQRVVVNGQFLIGAEASWAAARARFAAHAKPRDDAAQHHHAH